MSIFEDNSVNFSIGGKFIPGDKIGGKRKQKADRVDFSNANDFDIEFDVDSSTQSKPKSNRVNVTGDFTRNGSGKPDVVIDGDFICGDFVQGDKFEFNNFDF